MQHWAGYPGLKNRVVLIAEGGSGIGAEHVRQFCMEGTQVGFIDYDFDGSHRLIDQLASEGLAKPHFLPIDLRDIPGLERPIATFAGQVGEVKVLLNNAAHDQRHRLEDMTEAYFEERIADNLRHMVFCAKAVAPGMKRRGTGSIINFGSFPGGSGWKACRSMSPPKPGSKG